MSAYFEDENASTLADDKPAPVTIKRAGCELGRFVKICGQRTHAAESRDDDWVNARVCSSTNHDLATHPTTVGKEEDDHASARVRV